MGVPAPHVPALNACGRPCPPWYVLGVDSEHTVQKSLHLELVITSATHTGRSLPVLPGRFTIGADPSCDVPLELASVLPRHAEAKHTEDGALWLRGFQPGTVLVNGTNASSWALVTPGSFVALNQVELVLRERGNAQPSGTMRAPTPMRSSSARVSQVRPATHEENAGTAMRPSGAHNGGAVRSTGGRATTTEAHLTPGLIISDRYRIVSKIAAGGMGEVYKAEHVDLGRTFALKVMRPELSNDPEFVERFKREAVASGRIGHQNIVDITDFGRTGDGRFYFVMEFLDGRTLASLVGREGPQPLVRVLHITAQMLRALGAAHTLGIVHRDLKPENVMLLQRDGQRDLVKVVDFGVAKVSSGHGAGGQTAIGMVVGTPQYMAPEQAAGLGVDMRSDIYSLGLIVFEMLTGRPVFQGQTPSILMAMQMTEAPPPMLPGPLTWPLPGMLEQLVYSMLAKKPADRPQTTDAVLEVIEQLQQNINAPPSGLININAPVTQRPRTPTATASQRAPVPRAAPPPSVVAEAYLPQKSKGPLIGAAAFVAVLITGAVVFAVTRPAAVAPPPPVIAVPLPPPVVETPTPPIEPSAPTLMKLVVVTMPEKAAVDEDGIVIGTTPLPLSREKGTTLSLHFVAKGFKAQTVAINFTGDDATRVIVLVKDAPTPSGKKKKKDELMGNPYAPESELKGLPDQ